MSQDIWKQIDFVDALKFRVHGWETVGEMEGVTATYTAEYGRIQYEDPKRKYYLGLGELRTVAKLHWAPSALAPYLAAYDELLAMLKSLDPSTTRDDGLRLVHLLAKIGEPRLLHTIPKKGPEWAEKCPNGAIAAHYAAMSHRVDGLKVVLQRSPKRSASAPDAAGHTPLHYLADAGGPLSLFELLCMNGAQHQLATKKARGDVPEGSKAVDIARMRGHVELADALARRV